MKNAQQETQELIASIVVDDGALALRKEFLEFDDDDVALLRAAHAELTAERSEVAEAFYEHLLRFPALQKLLPDAAVVARLKSSQERYFSELTGADYGRAYIENRLAVGVVHRRVGLDPEWYIGAYRKYLALIAPILWKQLGHSPEQFFATYGAIIKIVSLDMSLAIDAYIQAERHEILAFKNYAEQIIAAMPSGLVVADLDGRIKTINAAARQMFDLDEAQGSLAGRHVGSLCEALAGYLQAAVDDSAVPHKYDVALSAAGSTRYLRCNISQVQVGEAPAMLIVVEDVTVSILARKELRESEERFRLAFGQAAVGLAHLDKEGRWLRVNQKLLDIVGHTEKELLAMTIREVTPAEEFDDYLQIWKRLLAGELNSYSNELRFIRKGGSLVWVNVTVAPIRSANGGSHASASTFIAVIEDISQRKDAEAKLLHLANHDPLTGLANRTLLLDRLAQGIIYAQRAHRYVAVLYIDLDRFKNVNDSLGHAMGDRLIIEVAKRLKSTVRSGDTVARLGGDEFVIVLADVAHDDEVSGIAQKIMNALLIPIFIEGQELSAVGSMGVSVFPRDGGDSATLLKNADAAMYRAKETGRSNIQFYEREMNARSLERLQLESRLRKALERNELVLHYQPQVDSLTRRIVGVEALLRWQESPRRMVPPAEFIGIAEETGLIVPIGEWVLRTACAQQVAWKQAGLGDIKMAINLSARQFGQKNLNDTICRILDETGCAPHQLELEITESILMADPESAAATMHQLTQAGVRIALDDFGTGYSSLSYLKKFPIHSLKIDRSFVRDITTTASDAAIAVAVITLAHSLKLEVIAEGIETREQLDFLSERYCDQMQGFYFYKPGPAQEITAFLR